MNTNTKNLRSRISKSNNNSSSSSSSSSTSLISSSILSSALQAELMRDKRLNSLLNPSNGNSFNHNRRPKKSSNSNNTNNNNNNNSQQPPHQQRLAVSLGIIPAPKPKLSRDEWHSIELLAQQRDQSICAICFDEFRNLPVYLLNCSHCFHSNCLIQYEQYSNQHPLYNPMTNNNHNNNINNNHSNHHNNDILHVCPLCRTPDYQYQLTDIMKLKYYNQLSIRIQSLYRGYCSRKLYKRIQPKNYIERRQWNINKLEYSNHLINRIIQQENKSIDILFNEIDKNIHSIREYGKAIENMAELITMKEWENIFLNTMNRINKESESNNNNNNNNNANNNKIKKKEKNTIQNHITCPICLIAISTEKWNNFTDSSNQSIIHNINNNNTNNNNNDIIIGSSNGNSIDYPNLLTSCGHLYHRKCLENYEEFIYNLNQSKFIANNNNNNNNNNSNNNHHHNNSVNDQQIHIVRCSMCRSNYKTLPLI